MSRGHQEKMSKPLNWRRSIAPRLAACCYSKKINTLLFTKLFMSFSFERFTKCFNARINFFEQKLFYQKIL